MLRDRSGLDQLTAALYGLGHVQAVDLTTEDVRSGG
jgi:hypothetical protein